MCSSARCLLIAAAASLEEASGEGGSSDGGGALWKWAEHCVSKRLGTPEWLSWEIRRISQKCMKNIKAMDMFLMRKRHYDMIESSKKLIYIIRSGPLILM